MRTSSFWAVLILALTPIAADAAPTVGPQPTVVLKKNTTLAGKHVIGAVGATVELRALLLAPDEEPVPKAKVAFALGGAHIGEATTDENGIATHKFAIPSTLGIGSTPFTVSFAGEGAYVASNGAGTLSVVKSSARLGVVWIPYGIATRVGDKIGIKGSLSRITDHSGIDGRAVELFVDGKSAGKATTVKGAFNFSVPAPNQRRVSLRARFDGDSLYLPVESKRDFADVQAPLKHVVILSTNTVAGRINFAVGQTHPFSAVVNDVPSGKRTAGIPVRFAVNGYSDGEYAIGDAKTDGNGVANIVARPTRAAAGTLEVLIPDDNYVVDNANDFWSGIVDIEIFPADLKITVTGPTSARIGETKTYSAKVVRTTDNAEMKDAKLRTAGGVVTTGANGQATFSVTFKSQNGIGPEAVHARFDPSDQDMYTFPSSNDATGSLTVQVGASQH